MIKYIIKKIKTIILTKIKMLGRMKDLNRNMSILKEGVNDWSVYFHKNQIEFEQRLAQLEERLAQTLEAKSTAGSNAGKTQVRRSKKNADTIPCLKAGAFTVSAFLNIKKPSSPN